MTVQSAPNSVPQTLLIAVVGDIHDAWDQQDSLALKALGVDLVLFVGDFGNEAVELVQAVSRLDLPYAAAFGNHDAWYTATPWGTKHCPYDRSQEDRVTQQLEVLGEAHVGYAHRTFPHLDLSVVGGRPFSWGGPEWRCAQFYQERFAVSGFAESSARITAAAAATPGKTIIFLGHNGPTGLGEQAEDPCGRDWQPLGGDFGDLDLRSAIAATQAAGKQIPLVAFGHMHHTLRHTKRVQRQRLCVDAAGTVYLNAACVPRIVKTNQGLRRNFSLVSLQNQQVTEVKLVWLDETFTILTDPSAGIATSETLYTRPANVLTVPTPCTPSVF